MSTKTKTSKSENEDGKMLITLLKNAKIFNNEDGMPMYRIKAVDSPEVLNFADAGKTNFMGYAFSLKNGENKLFLNPPKEIVYLLKKENKRLVKNNEKISGLEEDFGTDVFYGYYKIGDAKKASIERVEEDIELDDVDLNRSDMRAWSTRKMGEFLLHESPNFDETLACIAARTQHVSYFDSGALQAIADILESVRERNPVKKQVDEDEEEMPKPKRKTIKKSVSSFGDSSLQPYRRNQKIQRQNSQKKLLKQPNDIIIKRSKKKSVKKLNYMEMKSRIKNRLKKNLKKTLKRSLKKTLKRSLKKSVKNSKKQLIKSTKLNTTRNKNYLYLKMKKRTSRQRRMRSKGSRKNKRRSSKKMKRKSSKKMKRKTIRKSRGFGSIYGLQGSNISYTGLYPMEIGKMGVKPEFPNLYNVVRGYRSAA